jgi:polyphosphate kinase
MIDKSSKKDSAVHHQEIPPHRYINRELSWLAFNERVLEEAKNKNNPLLERVNFLSISATNLDEFTMVRVAGLMDHIRQHSALISDDGLTAEQQLELINARIANIINEQQKIWKKLQVELAHENICIEKKDVLSLPEKQWLEAYFTENIFPILTPIALDPAHPFPFLPNLGIAQIFILTRGKKQKEQIVIIPFPQKVPRFIALPTTEKNKNTLRYILLEDVIELNWEALFPESQKCTSTLLRIIRDSDLDIEEEAEDLVRYFERAVKRRRRGRIIRIKLASPTPPELQQFIIAQMQVESKDIISLQGMIGLSNVMEIADSPRPDLKYPPYNVRFPERITDYNGDCFAAIETKDIIVHHPFESFDVVVQFLRQAARDKDVVSIKQTLYRTSQDSPIIQALIEAAEAGKSVTAVVELKARFDEEANIKWARDLERAGAQVVYGFVHYKTHTKLSLVTRRVEGKLRSYMHFGTGNYHPNTAKVYTDLSFFTCDASLCRDAAQLFNFLTGYTQPKALTKLVIAPRDMRSTLIKLIDAEIAFAKAGKPAAIWAKMNALVDPLIIDALYNASGQNVKIILIVRGICCLRPGVAGISENITVKTIVGRFLEHARIFCFGAGHGLPSADAKVYLSSADWMPRNFDWRVEAMMPVENSTVHAQVMSQIMMANIKDEKNSWILGQDGNYTRVKATAKSFSAHEYFMHNPSLSGRGKALKKGKPGKTKTMAYLRKNSPT